MEHRQLFAAAAQPARLFRGLDPADYLMGWPHITPHIRALLEYRQIHGHRPSVSVVRKRVRLTVTLEDEK